MRRGHPISEYYEKYLRSLDLRYFLSGQIANTSRYQAIVSIQRSRQQGHVERTDVERMRLLLPHLRQAFDVSARLKGADRLARSLQAALDWLADGVALVRRDGMVLYVNDALRDILARNDGVHLAKGFLELGSAEARARFQAALSEVHTLRVGKARGAGASDFPVARHTAPPYLVSVRCIGARRRDDVSIHAAAIVFVHDPLQRNAGFVRLLREVFGFTEAEASIAEALRAGASPNAYARERSVSLNTVYTHLRRIKEKTGCRRMPELIHKLNGLQAPLRAD